MLTLPCKGLSNTHSHCISAISSAVVAPKSAGIGTVPWSYSFTNCIDAQNPTDFRKDNNCIGALLAR